MRVPIAFALICAALLALYACASLGSSRATVAPQEWNDVRGPVVPHDTFPTDCSLCHEGSNWRSIRADFRFDHAQETGTALLGAHAKAECLRCHNDRGPVGVFAQRGCLGCHEDVHEGHLGTNCADCHDETTWSPREQIAKHNRTRFPLVGAHAATACFACHPGAQAQQFDRADVACVACHASDLAIASDPALSNAPEHDVQGWVFGCDRCHVPTSWAGAGFTHSFFPLTGAHAALACAACHPGGVFTGASSDCFACHQDDYRDVDDPDHVAGGFPTNCALCHSTSTWRGAKFNHAGIRNGCVECHQDDYDGTSDPSHAAAGFPTTCELCHSTNQWPGADFDHDFPIDSGDHARLDCAQCHISPGNFRVFTCTQCHAHEQRDMDDEHERVRGYSYSSPACLSCHPNGKER